MTSKQLLSGLMVATILCAGAPAIAAPPPAPATLAASEAAAR